MEGGVPQAGVPRLRLDGGVGALRDGRVAGEEEAIRRGEAHGVAVAVGDKAGEPVEVARREPVGTLVPGDRREQAHGVGYQGAPGRLAQEILGGRAGQVPIPRGQHQLGAREVDDVGDLR